MRRECVNKFENEQDCPCPEENCERHGVCCECVRHHKEDNSLPECLRKKIS